jgi:hypothetical protein
MCKLRGNNNIGISSIRLLLEKVIDVILMSVVGVKHDALRPKWSPRRCNSKKRRKEKGKVYALYQAEFTSSIQ